MSYTKAEVALAIGADEKSPLRFMSVQDAIDAKDVTFADAYMDAMEDQGYGEGHVEEDPESIG